MTKERDIRSDSTLKTALKKITGKLGIPRKSIVVKKPNGLTVRSDITIGNLRKVCKPTKARTK